MSDTTPETGGALTVAEFCETYGVGRSLFYEELKAGRIEARKAGKRTLILRDEAERWARSLPKVENQRPVH